MAAAWQNYQREAAAFFPSLGMTACAAAELTFSQAARMTEKVRSREFAERNSRHSIGERPMTALPPCACRQYLPNRAFPLQLPRAPERPLCIGDPAYEDRRRPTGPAAKRSLARMVMTTVTDDTGFGAGRRDVDQSAGWPRLSKAGSRLFLRTTCHTPPQWT